jgi:hypothetical protein
VKRPGGDESIGVVIHVCMETIQELSLCSDFYLKLAKTPCFSYHLCFFFYKNRRAEQVLSGKVGAWDLWEGKVVGKGIGG